MIALTFIILLSPHDANAKIWEAIVGLLVVAVVLVAWILIMIFVTHKKDKNKPIEPCSTTETKIEEPKV